MTRFMTKQFAMLHATKGLEDYLSRERYNLDKMADNNRVTQSFFDSKVLHFNRLVDTLNQLFATLSDSPSSMLFDRYETDSEDEVEFHNASFTPPNIYGQPSFAQEVDLETVATKEDMVHVTSEPLVGSVDTDLSKQRAQAALDEYKETAERDVSTYLPEDDEPVDVMYTGKVEDEQTEYEDDTSDVEIADVRDDEEVSESETDDDAESEDEEDAFDSHYYSHTVDNVPVDFSGDPTQIATVETAVERYGKETNQGTDIDVSGFMYKSSDADDSFFDNLIDSEDLADLQSSNSEEEDFQSNTLISDQDEEYEDEEYEDGSDMVDYSTHGEDEIGDGIDDESDDDDDDEEFIDIDMDQGDFISHDSDDNQ